MQTRSSSKFIGEPSTNPTSTNPKRRNRRRSKQRDEPFALEETLVVTIADQRTMAGITRSHEGYAEAIVVPPIPAEHFELKHSLINLVTSTLKYKDMPETSIKLNLFPFSIDGLARIWLDKEPSRSILTWDDLVSKFINHLFPPSKTTNLLNEISNFQQKFEETFSESWDRFKDLLRACPHHGFTKLHQLDTFYNGLNPSDQDSLNLILCRSPQRLAMRVSLERSAQDLLKIIENKSKVRNSRNKPIISQVKASNVDSSEIASAVTSAMTAMFKQHQVTPSPAFVKAVKESCNTCGGAHSYRQCPATDGNTFSGYQDNIQGYVSAAAVNYNQGNTGYRPQSIANQFRPPSFAQPNVQIKGLTRIEEIISIKKLSLPELTPTRMILELADQKTTSPSSIAEDVFVKVGKFHFPADYVVVDYVVDPRVPLILGRPFLKMELGQTLRYSYNNSESVNRIDVIDVSCEEYVQEVLGFSDSSKSGNLTPILSTSFHSLTLFEGGDFILEEIKACLTNDSIPPGIDDADFDLEGDLLLLEKLLNDT
ncbi:reverse transcriptase domain-containing protein [Tanacetum coccineum]